MSEKTIRFLIHASLVVMIVFIIIMSFKIGHRYSIMGTCNVVAIVLGFCIGWVGGHLVEQSRKRENRHLYGHLRDSQSGPF